MIKELKSQNQNQLDQQNIEGKKLPKWKEAYYRVMIRVLHWLASDSFGNGALSVSIGGFYLILYAIILLFFGIAPNEKRWETFFLGIFFSILGIYHWLFYLPIKFSRLANLYRKKLGREEFVYGAPYDLKSE